jgi:hypothetical protein
MLTVPIRWIKGLLGGKYGLGFVLILAFAALLILYITSSPKYLTQEEVNNQQSSTSVSDIYYHAPYAPHRLLILGINKIGLHNDLYIRSVSILFAIIILCCFYLLAKSWYGRNIGLFSSLIFAFTPMFLINARLGTPGILFFWPVVIMSVYYSFTKIDTTHPGIKWFLLVIACALGLYIPGLIWWLAGSMLLARKQIRDAWNSVDAALIFASLIIGSIIVLPMVIASVHDIGNLQTLALVPDNFTTPLKTAQNIGWMFLALPARLPYSYYEALGRLPVLNLIQVALLVFGSFAMLNVARKKALVLFATIVFSVLAAGLNNDIRLLALGLPAIGLLIGAGLRYLYIEWKSVFPRNPVPQTLAIVLMAALVITHVFFGIKYALIAWPHAVATKTVRMIK